MHVSYLGSSESAAFIAANSVRIPFYSQATNVSASVEDIKNSGLGLNTMFTNNPAATFFV
jgi:DNA polymerase V